MPQPAVPSGGARGTEPRWDGTEPSGAFTAPTLHEMQSVHDLRRNFAQPEVGTDRNGTSVGGQHGS